MTRYAAETAVPSDRSRAEIERTLTRYGATRFMYAWETGQAVIGFEMHDRRIRFNLPMPDREQFRLTEGRRQRRKETAVDAAYEQSVRQRWRALALVVKAKLEAVESGITTFEEEFLAHIVLPGGRTMGEWAVPQIAVAYEKNTLPPMLPGGRD